MYNLKTIRSKTSIMQARPIPTLQNPRTILDRYITPAREVENCAAIIRRGGSVRPVAEILSEHIYDAMTCRKTSHIFTDWQTADYQIRRKWAITKLEDDGAKISDNGFWLTAEDKTRSRAGLRITMNKTYAFLPLSGLPTAWVAAKISDFLSRIPDLYISTKRANMPDGGRTIIKFPSGLEQFTEKAEALVIYHDALLQDRMADILWEIFGNGMMDRGFPERSRAGFDTLVCDAKGRVKTLTHSQLVCLLTANTILANHGPELTDALMAEHMCDLVRRISLIGHAEMRRQLWNFGIEIE